AHTRRGRAGEIVGRRCPRLYVKVGKLVAGCETEGRLVEHESNCAIGLKVARRVQRAKNLKLSEARGIDRAVSVVEHRRWAVRTDHSDVVIAYVGRVPSRYIEEEDPAEARLDSGEIVHFDGEDKLVRHVCRFAYCAILDDIGTAADVLSLRARKLAGGRLDQHIAVRRAARGDAEHGDCPGCWSTQCTA